MQMHSRSSSAGMDDVLSGSGTGEHVLGLSQGTVRPARIHALWADLFRIEAMHLRGALRELALDDAARRKHGRARTESAAATGYRGGDPCACHCSKCATSLARLGYQYAYWADLENDFTFEKGIERTHHVHLASSRQSPNGATTFDSGTPADQAPLACDRTRQDRAWCQFCRDRAAYTRAKAAFILMYLHHLATHSRRCAQPMAD